MSFSVLERPFTVLEHLFLLCSCFVLRGGTGQAVKISYCPVLHPVPDFDRLSWPGPALGKILSLSHCPFGPGQWGNFAPFVPKSSTVPSRWKPYSLPLRFPDLLLALQLLTYHRGLPHTLTTTHLRNPKFFKTSLHIWRLITADEKCFTSLTNVLC